MAGIILLLALCAVMAIASFLAGALPLSMTLSQSQLRLISSIGVGILVGTSLIVIIPEGIEAAASTATSSHAHKVRSVARRSPWTFGMEERDIMASMTAATVARREAKNIAQEDSPLIVVSTTTPTTHDKRQNAGPPKETPSKDKGGEDETKHDDGAKHEKEEHLEIPGFEVGFSLVLGFILMFLIDRLPRHASESLQSGQQPLSFSLDNLVRRTGMASSDGVAGGGSAPGDEETDGFLGSLAPTPKHTRSLATTIGLVIHAAADGIAMGASAATSNMKLGFIIFIAIMIHKAPAAFGLTSVLLKQGLSKRAARGHLIIFSMAAPVGALSTWLLIKLLGGDDLDDESGMWWTGMLLLFSGGSFLYVAMHAMQEDGSAHGHDGSSGANGYGDGTPVGQRKTKGPQMRDTLGTVAGMLLPLLTQFGHHH